MLTIYKKLSLPDFSDVALVKKLSVYALLSLSSSSLRFNTILLLSGKETISDMIANNVIQYIVAILSRNPPSAMVSACHDLLLLIGNKLYADQDAAQLSPLISLISTLEV